MKRIIILALLAWLALQPQTDPDLGWHLRYGQYFFQTGHVLRDNIVSFVWPDYKWVQASWGYDLLTYQIFNHFGFWGLSIAGSLTTLVIFFLIISPIRRLGFWVLLFLAALFLSQSASVYGGGFRAQTLSSLFFSLAMILSWKSLIQPSKIIGLPAAYFLPLLFLGWANFHGGFALGLIMMWLMWLVSGAGKIISFRLWILSGVSLAASSLAPLANPWGWRIYQETFKHTINLNLSVINEWLPLSTWPLEAVVTGIAAISVIGLAVVRKDRRDFPYLLGFLLVTYLAFSALRFTINFGIMATFYWARHLSFGKQPTQFWKNKVLFGKLALLGLIAIDSFFFKRYFYFVAPFSFPANWNDICNLSHECSVPLAKVINQDPPQGNGYHPYNWGGFLIWNVPQIKTFLDGRMAAWEQDGKTPPVVEDSLTGTGATAVGFKRLDAKYNFSWVIIPTNSRLTEYFDELTKQRNWEMRYKDEWSAYYVRSD